MNRDSFWSIIDDACWDGQHLWLAISSYTYAQGRNVVMCWDPETGQIKEWGQPVPRGHDRHRPGEGTGLGRSQVVRISLPAQAMSWGTLPQRT